MELFMITVFKIMKVFILPFKDTDRIGKEKNKKKEN
jgi:hypothetical protein